MSFDWNKYQTIADQLIKLQDKQGIEEAYYRTAASRSYFAAFHSVRKVLELAGTTIPRGKEHEFVRGQCASSSNKKYTIIGNNLSRLHNNRVKADYKSNYIFVKNDAESSCWLANSIFNSVKNIDPKKDKP
jgi:uncharacterized protein (UPF0332 family)